MVTFYLDHKEEPQTHELTPDGFQQTLPFHLLICGRQRMGDKYYVKRDGMKNYLILLTTEGCGRISWKGMSCVLGPGSAVLIDCNDYHEYETMPGSVWGIHYLHFQALSMEGYRNIFLRKLTPVMLRSPEFVWGQVEQMYRTSCQTNAAGYIMLSNFISVILTEMVCSLADNEENEAWLNRTDISELTEYIRRFYREDLHIEDFMRHTSLSRHYLIHVFERQVGMPPYRFLHMCRINKAQILLKTTDLSVAEISESVGYNSVAVFIRHFKSFIGVTPGVYRSESIY